MMIRRATNPFGRTQAFGVLFLSQVAQITYFQQLRIMHHQAEYTLEKFKHKGPIEEIKAITTLFATTVCIGILKKTNNTGIIIKAPPAPITPEIAPMTKPVNSSTTLLNFKFASVCGLILIIIKTSANIAMTTYTLFTNLC